MCTLGARRYQKFQNMQKLPTANLDPSLSEHYSDARYLSSKRTVDDRALNKQVLDQLRRELGSLDVQTVKILEVGAGLGTMAARLVDWGYIRRASYVLVDQDRQLLVAAREWLASWAAERGFRTEPRAMSLAISGEGALDLTVSFVAEELEKYLDTAQKGAFDLLIANAFLDLVDVPRVLPHLLGLLDPQGAYWVSINYDGDTIFCPEHEHDEAFMRVYNRSMDERVRFGVPAGSSKTGRALFGHLRAAGASIAAAGASDWIVFGQNGQYPADERYFLHHIIHTIDAELRKHPEVARHSLSEWVALRRQQIERGDLVYIAHQLDFVGRARSDP